MINLWLVNTKQLFPSIHMRLNSGKYFKHQCVVIINQYLLFFQVSNNMYVLVCVLPLNISLLFNLYGSVGCEICKVYHTVICRVLRI